MDEEALTRFGAEVSVFYDPTLVEDRPSLLAAVAEVDALIVRNRTRVDAEVLEAAPRLRVIGRLGVGLDNIDLNACAVRGVTVRPATGANTLSVAEYVIAAMLMLVRGCFDARAQMEAGDWPRTSLIGGEIAGRRLGLLGYGEIARAVAERARALGMEIAAHDPYLPADHPAWNGVARCDFGNLLVSADVLSLHVPMTPETRGLIGQTELARMKPGAVLINTARGGVIDEEALAAALRRGDLAGAALDVFAQEPLTAEAAQKFAGLKNIFLTPHVAGVTTEGNGRVSRLTVENVIGELKRLE
ncbi:hydroxyacid dehydrogenase [Palleronia caenipelagi]|uniref:Hydroxyacid dehydrogenase n=2 Tax=Palleronia caenipelagi TaxID=2489174 RepID=A0A547Q064_9RHOB|nr:hydroxyacid dehydrogenase [Palleronia caenipelagi]